MVFFLFISSIFIFISCVSFAPATLLYSILHSFYSMVNRTEVGFSISVYLFGYFFYLVMVQESVCEAMCVFVCACVCVCVQFFANIWLFICNAVGYLWCSFYFLWSKPNKLNDENIMVNRNKNKRKPALVAFIQRGHNNNKKQTKQWSNAQWKEYHK